ncbi:TPA: hypothetical protein ACNYO2_001011 [Streptococcus pyogenes]|nr:hypothetical protein [Streptococcus pyogenes]HER6772787.1 hypothetical protein [Streptococcus pyogenes]HER8989794.1 hypothetical protein [Streptococcus pyogenes]HES1680569.1 hypothetical protein [Streptococcus pyogenes]HES4044507.1 hypothetical protein [Streptococcus pyogenes]
MKIEFFLKHGPTKSISNHGEIVIDEVIGAMENNDVVALDGKNNAVIIPKQNISHVIIYKEVTE